MVTVDATSSAPGAVPDVASSPPGRLRPGQVLAAAWGVVVAQLVIRGWAAWGGFLYADDFVLQSRSARLPFPGADLLLTDVDGRLMPAGMVVAWVTTQVAPLSQVGVVVGLLVMQAIASLAVLAMLHRMFGPRTLMLVPLGLYLLTPLTLPSFLWWSSALGSLPLQAGLALAVWAHVGYLRSGRRSDLALTWAMTLAALAFSEKASLIPLALVGVTWILDRHDGTARSLWSALAGRWRLWLGWLVLVAGYVAWYRSTVGAPPLVGGSTGQWWRFARQGFVDAFWVPLVGGPVSWLPVGTASALADPPAWVTVLVAVAVVAFVGASCWVSPRGRRAWLFLVGYVAVDLAVIAAVRGAGEVTNLAPLTLRYTADAAVVAAIAVGVSVMSPLGEAEPRRRAALRERLVRRPPHAGLALFLAVDVFVLLTTISTLRLGAIWADNPAGGWIRDATRTLAEASPTEPVIPQPVPETVLSALAYPDNLTSRVLAPVARPGQFARQTSVLTAFDASGTLVPAHVEGASAPLPPDGSCWLASEGRGLVPLDAALPPFEHVVRLAYIAGSQQEGTVALGGGEAVPVEFQRGLSDLYLVLTGGGTRLYVTLRELGPTVCISQADVGNVVPGPRDPR
jgi:hypothetical protein